MRSLSFVWLLVLWHLALWLAPGVARAAEPQPVEFDRDVRPILASACFKCHGQEKQQGGLRFDRASGLTAAGDSGSQAVVARKASQSELIRRIESTDDTLRMPQEAAPLKPEQVQILRAWIDQGAVLPMANSAESRGPSEMIVTAEDRQHWSYRPLREVTPPAGKDAWRRTTIDDFILAALNAKGLRPNPAADRRTLIRRVYFDLVGLPPAPAEVAAFVADPSPQAYEALVDKLLTSRHYGERWGRHWLDLARYADSAGMELDYDRPTVYHYRDFVIRALNDDLPYQTFVRWQLAGDEYEPDNPLALAGTGFLSLGPSEMLGDQLLEEERLRLRFNELDDMAVTSVSALLGLTLGCARCHDHKFDAIPTRDYYRLQCAFTTTARGDVLLAPREEVAAYRQKEARWRAELDAAQGKLNDWLADANRPHTERLRNAKIDALSISDSDKRSLKEQPNSPLAKSLEKALAISDAQYREVLDNEQRRQWDERKREVAAIERRKPAAAPAALAIVDTKPEPLPTWLLKRGDFYVKQEPLELGFLSVLTRGKSPADYLAAARQANPAATSTRQRRALADWITDVEHGAGPLLARVIVNRVWQHHFGEGVARTVSDLGVRGEEPTHPELLEWLAHDFVASGWRLKRLHRLVVTSAVYCQDTTYDEARARIDPDHRLLWRRRPQRLESEILRDSVLSVSGALNLAPYGPAFKPPIPAEAIVARNVKDPYPKDARDTPATQRRTVYMFHKRVVQHPLMQVFDGPDAAVSCGRRSCTTVAPQALALLNDTFIRARAGDFAGRLIAEGGPDADHRVEQAFLLALSRPPSAAERTASLEFVNEQVQRRAQREPSAPREEVERQALADFCQTLFGLNEFVYVD